MKLAYLINQYPQPSQSFIRREICALEAIGHHVDRFTIRTWDQQLVDEDDLAEKAKTRVILDVGWTGLTKALLSTLLTRPQFFFRAMCTACKLGKKGERGRLYHLIYLAEACVLLAWLRRSGSQHVHAHFGTNSAAVALLVHQLGGPGYSFTCHGPEEFDRPIALKLGEKICQSRFVVAVSEFGKSQLYRWCPNDQWHKIHVVHCGVDAAYLITPAPPMSDTRRLVSVGRLVEQKGQLLLVEAARLLATQNVPFQLTLIGDGPLREALKALIGRYQLGDRITLAGWQNNAQVRDAILMSRALILPSFAEGLPVVAMEALALHRPVVATFIAGIPELVESGKCGYLLPAGNAMELAEAMKRILSEDVASLMQMGEEGARRVADRHNARREAEKLSTLFENAR